jgi:phosphoglycolate phosphatase
MGEGRGVRGGDATGFVTSSWARLLRMTSSTPEVSSPYSVLVFDWDGTLVDSIGTIVECTRTTLVELSIPVPEEHTLRGVIGLGLRETVGVMVPGCDEATYQQIVLTYRKHWFGTFQRQTRLFRGARQALDELRARGYSLAVATGKSRRGLESELDATGIRAHFLATRTASEAPSKPHPQMLLDLITELGVDAAAALMIGDTSYDLEMARGASMRAVAVTSGGHDTIELERFDPLACLAGVHELPNWLAKQMRPAASPRS